MIAARAALLVLALLLGGCMSSSPQHGIVHDNKLTLDFTHRPTRAEVGIADGRTFVSYDRHGPMLQATVLLPTGRVVLPAFNVNAATDAGGGAIDRQHGLLTHEPKYFDILRRFDDSKSAWQSLTDDADVLGLSRTEIDTVLPNLGARSAIPQSFVLHGLVHDWLSLEITLSDEDDGSIQADYAFSVDVFHNPAIDKVVHDGVFALDLSRRPTRADLAFLDDYPTATIRPSWQHALRIELTLPGGRVETTAQNVTSTAKTADGPPTATRIAHTGSIAAVRALLTSHAAALGLDAARIPAAFEGPDRTLAKTTLTGAHTDVFDLSVQVECTVGQPGNFAATATLAFTYR